MYIYIYYFFVFIYIFVCIYIFLKIKSELNLKSSFVSYYFFLFFYLCVNDNPFDCFFRSSFGMLFMCIPSSYRFLTGSLARSLTFTKTHTHVRAHTHTHTLSGDSDRKSYSTIILHFFCSASFLWIKRTFSNFRFEVLSRLCHRIILTLLICNTRVSIYYNYVHLLFIS